MKKLSLWVKLFITNLVLVVVIFLIFFLLNLKPDFPFYYLFSGLIQFLAPLLFITGGLIFIKDPHSILEWYKFLIKIEYRAEVKFTESNVKWTKVCGYIYLTFGLFLLFAVNLWFVLFGLLFLFTIIFLIKSWEKFK